MVRNRVYSLIVVAIIALFLFSCVADDLNKLQKPNWNPEIAIPLVDSRFGIERIVSKFEEEGFLKADNQGVVVVVYNGTIFEIDASDIFEIDDFSFDLALTQGAGITKLPVNLFALRTLELEEGNLRIHIEDNIQEDISVTLNMPESRKNGIAFGETFGVNYNGGGKIIFDTIFDLSDYDIDLSGNGDERNKLNINYTAKKVSNNDAVLLDKFIVSFEDLAYRYIDGYFGKLDFGTFSDSMKIDMFKNFKSGRILLESPKFELNIESSFGMPIHMNFGNFQGNGIGGSSTLGGSVVNSGVNVNAPSTPSTPSNTSNTIDSSNSNISQFLAITPSSLNFSFDLDANLNADSSTINFLSNTSELIGSIALELPLKGSLDSVIFEDIYDFDTGELNDVDRATFKLFTNNSFPVGIYIQIYFLDKNELVIDSLIEDNSAIFREAITDANGFSIQTVEEESYFTLGRDRFINVRDRAKKIKIKAMLLTDDSKNKSVKITEDDYFDLKLGLRALLNF